MTMLARRSALAALFGSVAALALRPARADQATRGTPAEAQAMVADAVAYFDRVGAEAAFGTFNTDPKPRFWNGDLYIFVDGVDGTIAANAFQPDKVGSSAFDLVDANGVVIGRKVIDEATGQGIWVDYLYPDPATGQNVAKSSWVVRHGDYVFGCGIYKE